MTPKLQNCCARQTEAIWISQTKEMVRSAVWGELVSGKTFPDLRDFSGNIAFWVAELGLLPFGNGGSRALGTQIR
jgi:hypothetical protein